MDHAVVDRQLLGGGSKPLRRQAQKSLPGRRAGESQVGAIKVRWVRLASRGGSLIGRERRVAVNEPDSVEGYGEFFGDKLSLDSRHSLADFGLARIGGHDAVCCNGN